MEVAAIAEAEEVKAEAAADTEEHQAAKLGVAKLAPEMDGSMRVNECE